MRKTLLLAAAALAASVISSNAQVYSQNIVGYANTVIPAGYSLACNPFSTGVSNGLNEAASSLPVGATILIWNGVGYNQAQYAPGYNDPNTIFIDPNSTADIPTPIVVPGTAFFIQNPGSAVTNTWVGTVITNTVTLASGYSLVSSPVPYGGDVTNTAINMNLVVGATLLFWNGVGFDQAQYAPGYNTPSTVFIDPNSTADIPDPVLNVGEGFFYQNPSTSVTWSQAYP